MQIHELSRKRRTDEGLGDIAKSVGTALKQAVAGPEQNTPSASAGILDPVQKLAAVKKNPDMVRIATQYAKEWTASQSKAVPESVTERRVGKKKASRTGILPQDDISGFSKQAQQQIQQQIQAQQQSASPAAPAQPAAPAAPVAPAITPGAQYLKDFLAFANEKIAMRDSTTYRMIGLTDVENSKLKPQLDAAKQAVVAARGNPIATETAVKNYILTAMAGAQLVASKNKIDNASPKAPAYGGQQAPTKLAAGQSNSASQGQPIDIQALIKNAGLDATALQKAAAVMQKATQNNKLRATGDDAIDGMLSLMGYTVS